MLASDLVKRTYREFKRFTGDGLPGEPISAPLPVGDPQSGVHSPKKSELREMFLAVIKDAAAVAALEVVGGTANAVIASSASEINPDQATLLLIQPTATNTGNVTLKVGSGVSKPVRSYNGAELPAGTWAEDSLYLLSDQGAEYRLVNDPASAAAAAASAAAAEEAAISVQGLDATAIQGRLSLTSAVPSPVADVANATSIYYVPSQGRYVPVYNGTSMLAVSVGSQLTLALNANSGHSGYQAANTNYDLFVVNDGGTARLVTGPSWNAGAVAGSDIVRGTGAGSTELEVFNGILVNKNTMSVRFGSASGDTLSIPARRATYIGSFRTTAAGQASDTKAKRLMFNAFNRNQRDIRVTDATADWDYSLATMRQARGQTSNQVEMLFGLSGVVVDAELSVVLSHTVADGLTFFSFGIGVDSTTAVSADCVFGAGFFTVANRATQQRASYRGSPGLGYHRLTWLEVGNGTATLKWYGSGFRSGIYGSFLG